jgi:hypothetical protein
MAHHGESTGGFSPSRPVRYNGGMTIAAEELDPDVAAALVKAKKKRRGRGDRASAGSPSDWGKTAVGVGLVLAWWASLVWGLVLVLTERPLGWFLFLASGLFFLLMRSWRRRVIETPEAVVYDGDALAQLLPTAKLNRVEQEYAGALVPLLNDALPMDAAGRRRTLDLTHGLLRDYRALRAERKRLEGAVKAEDADAVRKEARRLRADLEKAADPAVRESKAQTLRMVERRLEDLEAWQRVVPRLEAQEEAVTQTLATLRVGLLRLAAAPATPAATRTTGEELESLVADVTRRTRAVEQAVQEVETLLTVRSG